MSEEYWDITGFNEPPIAQLEARFYQIADKEMKGLPFYHNNMPIKACGFTLFQKQWIGALLTPWMLELVIIAEPEQEATA